MEYIDFLARDEFVKGEWFIEGGKEN